MTSNHVGRERTESDREMGGHMRSRLFFSQKAILESSLMRLFDPFIANCAMVLPMCLDAFRDR